MSDNVALRELEKVVRRVMRFVPKTTAIQKRDFEVMLDEIVMCVHRNRKISIDAIVAKSEKVLTDLPNEYGGIPESYRSSESLIGYLYSKYLKELGQL